METQENKAHIFLLPHIVHCQRHILGVRLLVELSSSIANGLRFLFCDEKLWVCNGRKKDLSSFSSLSSFLLLLLLHLNILHTVLSLLPRFRSCLEEPIHLLFSDQLLLGWALFRRMRSFLRGHCAILLGLEGQPHISVGRQRMTKERRLSQSKDQGAS